MKLSDLITTTAQHSSVDHLCQVNPSHVTKDYMRIAVKTPNVTQDNPGQIRDIVDADKLFIEVCDLCFNMWMVDMASALRDLPR